MSCILRVSGELLDIDNLLALHSSLIAECNWKKGEPRIIEGKFQTDSGANFVVSDANLDEFNLQIKEATEFLQLYASVIAKMVQFPGVENAVLDFGVAFCEGSVAQFSFLPAEFIELAATAGVAVGISHYLCSEEDVES